MKFIKYPLETLVTIGVSVMFTQTLLMNNQNSKQPKENTYDINVTVQEVYTQILDGEKRYLIRAKDLNGNTHRYVMDYTSKQPLDSESLYTFTVEDLDSYDGYNKIIKYDKF